MEAAASPAAPATPVRPGRRQLLLGAGHLAGLWAITFAQPLLDLLGQNPDFFVARGNSVGDILILAFGMVIVPPLIMLAIEWIALKISDRVYMGVHFFFVAAIATFLFFQFQKNTGLPTLLIVVIGVGLGVLFAYALFRSAFLKNLMDILIAAPIVVLVMFVFFSNANKLIFPDSDKVELASNPNADTPVVLVIFDELGTNGLMTNTRTVDARRYPNFAKLEKTSTWYKDQSTTAYFTPRAVPGILTGENPSYDTLPTSADQPNSIFTQLGKDYKFHVMEPVTQICPESLCPREEAGSRQLRRLKALASDLKYVEGRLVLPPGLADRLPDVGTNFDGFGGNGDDTSGDAGADKKTFSSQKEANFVKGRGGASEPAEYEAFINSIPETDKGFTMMHLHLPHQPWKYDVQGEQYNTSNSIEQLSKSTGPWLVDDNGVATSQARMYTQTGYADTLVGEIRKSLIQKGLWDKAMVIVTADHGISFQGDGVPQRQADDRAMGDVANPPLFIKYPGQKKGVVSLKPSKTLDIVPTIAQTLGLNLNYEPEGVPLQGPVPERPVEVTDIEGNVYSVSVQQMVRQRDAGIARSNKRIGTGPIYTLGPAPELLGLPAPPVPAAVAPKAKATLDDEDLYADYVPGEDLIPMFITGTSDGLPEGTLIAVGVNGKIRGTAKTFAFEGADHFGALVDPASLKAGANRINLYEADGKKLTPLGGN